MVAFTYFYHQINEKYPAPKVEEIAMDTPFLYSYDKNFQITVTDFSFLSEEELKQLDVESGLEERNRSQDSIGYLVTVKIKNIGKEKASIEYQVFSLQSGIFNNGTDGIYNGVLNPDVRTGPYDAGEERTIKMSYTASSNLFRKEHWDKVKNLKYELVTSLYPVEQKVILN